VPESDHIGVRSVTVGLWDAVIERGDSDASEEKRASDPP
jgi:hypothetical protein